MLKVLYVCRLFSGLEESINNKRWRPTGVPTIYRVIDKLKKNNKYFKLILTSKGGFTKLNLRKNSEIFLPDFVLPITVLVDKANCGKRFKLIKNIYREISQFITIMYRFFLFNPDILYIDHGNIWSAGLLARFTKTPVVFRVMGVYAPMHDTVNTKNPSLIQKLLKWLYRAPFELVICTQDGSGVENWLRKALKKSVKVEILLNGLPKTNYSKTKTKFSKEFKYITFLGKLEHAKGAKQFVEAMCRVLKKNYKKKILVNVVGFGSLREELIEYTKSFGLSNYFNFIERLPNDQIIPILKNTDIYVSLNRAGNLSNANLEAIATNCCIIIPESKKINGIDVFTDSLLPLNAVFRIKDSDDINGLTRLINNLLVNEKKILETKKELKKVKKSLKDWEQRIDYEIKLLEQIINN